MSFLTSGSCESFKGGYHAFMSLLACGAVAYNALAWTRRREAHLAVNALVYGSLAYYEYRKACAHTR